MSCKTSYINMGRACRDAVENPMQRERRGREHFKKQQSQSDTGSPAPRTLACNKIPLIPTHLNQRKNKSLFGIG